MTVRSLNNIVRIGIAIMMLGLLLAVIAGLFERPFALWPYLGRIGLTLSWLALTPYHLKTMRDREARYGLDGVVPGAGNRLKIMLMGLVVLIVVAAVVVLALGYHHGFGH